MGRYVALLICAALLPYLPILSSSFLMDTHSLLIEAWERLMMGLQNAFTSPIGGGFRPLSSLSVFWTAWWFEGSEIAHRGINYLIHAGTTLVTWRVALRLGLTPGGALVAGLLFALSPSLAFLVPWVAGRPDMLAGLSAGLIFLAHARYAEAPSGRRLTVVYLAILMLVMSKEVGLLVPAVLFAFGRGHRRSYGPLLLLCLAWGALRVHFHEIGYAGDEEIQRLYSPLTLIREPDRLLEVLAGTGRVVFCLFTCTLGPWQVAGGGIGVTASLLGWAMLLGLVASGVRQSLLGTAFGLALLVPCVPFLDKDLAGYYLYSPAVFFLPVLIQAIWRRPEPIRKILIGALLVVSAAGSVHHVVLWHRAASRFHQEVEALRPLVQTTIEDVRESNGRPHLVQVLGLPLKEGPIWLFPPPMSPSGLTSPFFPYYRTTLETDELYLQFLLVRWRIGPLTPAEEEMATNLDMVRKRISAR